MDRVRGGKGYLLIDNRAAGLGVMEYDTMTCAHCMTVVVLNALRKRERGFCWKCHAYVCDDKVCAEECTPIGQTLEGWLKET